MKTKLIIILALIFCICGCKQTFTTSSSSASDDAISIQLGTKKYIRLPRAKNQSYTIDHQNMGSLQRTLFVGKLSSPSHLELTSGKIILTQISMQAATNIETGFLQMPLKQNGKYALVRGNWDGQDMVYQAEIVCILNRDWDDKLQQELEAAKTILKDICQ